MIEIRLLGGLDVSGPLTDATRAILARPKTVALLAYLAVQPRFRRRDALVGLLWPEMAQAGARARLRKAVFQLRQALGAEAVENRGSEEIALRQDRVTSDVHRMETALATGQAGLAVELHAGDLLPGFFLSGAPEWERWLEDERRRLRELARSAALRLAGECERHGQADEAARWAREACRVAPEDETAAGELLRLLADRGDRAAALRHYDRFARRLEHELDIQPSAGLRALAASIRQPPDGTAAGVDVPVALPGTAPRPIVPARDRPPMVAILPFAYSGQPALRYVADGLAGLLATALGGSESLGCADPEALAGWAARSGLPPPGTERCQAVGESFDATYCVAGRAVESAGQLRVSATLRATADPTVTLARVSAQGGADELFSVVDRLAAELLVAATGAPVGELARLAVLTTESLPALKCHLDGEIAFRAGRFTVAADRFRQATMDDPTFALAHYRLAVLCEWVGMHAMAAAAAAQAVFHAERLSLHDQRLLAAFQAYIAGDAGRAEMLYRELLDVYPDSLEAWFHLAKVGYFLDSLRGRRLAGARPALERAAELDPDNIIILVHLASVAAKERQPALVDAASEHALALLRQGDHMDSVLLVRLQRAHATDDADERERLWHELETANDVTLFWSLTLLTVVVGALEAARRVAALMTRPSRPREVRLHGHLALAELALAHGSWSRALDELDAASQLDADAATVHRGLLAMARFRSPDRAELLALREALLALPAGPPAPADPALPLCFTAHVGALDTTRSYLLGLVHVHLGEPDAALALADALDLDATTLGPAPLRTLARDSARGVRALLAHCRGDDARALALLEDCELTVPMHLYTSTALHGRLHERFLRAELLGSVGRDAEAEGWYAALGEDSPHGSIYLGPSLARRAELMERGGDVVAADGLRARLAELWRESDPALRAAAGPTRTGRDDPGYVACEESPPARRRSAAISTTSS